MGNFTRVFLWLQQGVVLTDMSVSVLTRLTLGVMGQLSLDFEQLLNAPQLVYVDIWSSRVDLRLREDIEEDILPKERPLKIIIESEEGFNDEDVEILENIGLQVTHSTPACECCGVSLSVWYATYCSAAYLTKCDPSKDQQAPQEWWEALESSAGGSTCSSCS